MKVKIEKLINGLREFSDSDFTCDSVYNFLGKNPIEIDSISSYLFWSEKFYTRNLIYKDERFEMMAVCWDKGQISKVHNHADQKCWMTVVEGKLRGQNFSVEEIDSEKKYCKLRETDMFDLSDCLAAKVELEEPIHQILNLKDFDERAVSVHIYSKPIESCLAYCRDTHSFKEVELFYTSINGKLCQGISL
ncbi:MAG: cysteine dioxygenase family protein [Acidobacteriota bacterium]